MMSTGAAWAALIVAGVATTTLGGCAGTSDEPQGGCPAFVATARPTAVKPGDEVELFVDYSTECTDNFVNGTPDPVEPEGDGIYRNVEVTWSQDGATTVLATLDADSANHLRATVTVPPTAPTGVASLGAQSSGFVLMTVESP